MLSTRTLGTQGLNVSALGLGLMGMTQAYGKAEDRDEREGPRYNEKQMSMVDR